MPTTEVAESSNTRPAITIITVRHSELRNTKIVVLFPETECHSDFNNYWKHGSILLKFGKDTVVLGMSHASSKRITYCCLQYTQGSASYTALLGSTNGLLAGRECESRIASYYTHRCRGLSQSDIVSGLVHLPPPTCCVCVSLCVCISISENSKPRLAISYHSTVQAVATELALHIHCGGFP